MDAVEQARYERLVYDGARDMAHTLGADWVACLVALADYGPTADERDAVKRAVLSPAYHPEPYRGKLCDLELVEVLKDVLRRHHGFVGSQEERMRQGPQYSQWVDRDPKGQVSLRLPLELEHDWRSVRSVVWRDNGDGTYTLKPSVLP